MQWLVGLILQRDSRETIGGARGGLKEEESRRRRKRRRRIQKKKGGKNLKFVLQIDIQNKRQNKTIQYTSFTSKLDENTSTPLFYFKPI